MIITNQFIAEGLLNCVGASKDLEKVVEGNEKLSVVHLRYSVGFSFWILANGRNVGKVSKSYYVTMRFNKLDDSLNLGFGRFNRDRKIEHKISDKYDQPTIPRVAIYRLDFFENDIEGVVGILKHFNIMF